MGYCGLKIPGHSETDYKHKKAFASRNKLLNPAINFENVTIESRENGSQNVFFTFYKIVLGILSSVIILIFIYFIAIRIDNLSFNRTHLSPEYLKSIEIGNKIEAAQMLYTSSKLYFDSGALDYAQEEITLVLKLYPTNIEALQLMHHILEKQCEVKNMFCGEANEYKEYLDFKKN